MHEKVLLIKPFLIWCHTIRLTFVVIQDPFRFFCHLLDLLVSPAIILYQGGHLTSQMVYYLITHVGLFLAVVHCRLIHFDEFSQPAIVLLESDQLNC